MTQFRFYERSPSNPLGGILLVLSALILVSTGCATKIKVNMLEPAQYHEASMTRTVAVLPFSGPGGAEIASEIEGVLGSISIDGKPYFTLVDRAQIDKTLGEMKLSQSGLVDQSTAARIGKMVGAQGIYTGMVTLSGTNDSPYSERRQQCVQHQMKYDNKGNAYEGPCVRWRPYTVSCMKRVASFACSPKLIEVSTGKIIYARNLSGSTDSSGCEDRTPVKGEAELLQKAKEIAKTEFRKNVAPFYVTREIALMDSTDGISSSEAKDKLKNGLEYAAKQRMDSACELWGEANILSPNAPSILYNLGVCAESRGDLDAALSLYKRADKLIGKPEDNVTLALNRVTEAIKNRKKLAEELKGSGL
jgi:hypothetical protein